MHISNPKNDPLTHAEQRILAYLASFGKSDADREHYRKLIVDAYKRNAEPKGQSK